MRRTTAARFLALLAALSVVGRAGADDLYSAFAEPPARLRPFVRWWWNGARVDEQEALRQLDVMKAAGIGGVEINTIAMPDSVPVASLAPFPVRPWLSPEWCRVVKAAAEGARARGMTADVIVGSGWPFGGRFLAPAEQTKRVRVVTRELLGPAAFEATVEELARAGAREREEVSVPPQVVSARLNPAAGPDFAAGAELLPGAVRAGRLRVRVPAGPHVLRVVLLETGFTHVKLGAPGADGPVVDHWNAAAVRRYLDHMSAGLAPALGGALGEAQGGPLRAAFVDSLELDHANWTDDLPAEFARRRGYPLAPYLPFLLEQDDAGESARSDTVRRARYDFNRTLVELFHERFLATYVEWAHASGLLARIQAYGRETHVLEGSLLPDLPEGESWLWSGHDRVIVSPTVANKYVSSGAHLGGRGPVSFEAMTNAVPVFRETLEDFKLGLDQSLLAGVQQPVLHGFNYSPLAAGFPGWVRFGSWLNETNPWWPHFRRFADYAARLTSVLTASEFQASVALLGPRADEWARDGRLYQPFPEVSRPWYHYHLWQALAQAGFGSDFVSEGVLQGARVEGGRLRCGTRGYDTLVLMDVDSLEPRTAEAVARFSESGGRLVFVGHAPARAPGLLDAAAADGLVRSAMARALRGERAALVPAPAPGGPLPRDVTRDVTRDALPAHARRSLLQWAVAWSTRLGLEPDVRLDAPSVEVSLLHQRAGERELFFLANASRGEAIDLVAHFPAPGKRPWLWDAETGARTALAPGAQPGTLALHFEPLQSLLVVYELPGAGDRAGGEPVSRPRRGRDELPVLAPWTIAFRPPIGETFERRVPQLFDLSLAAGDPEVAGFGGVATYRVEFEWADTAATILSLGQVNGISSARLNGRDLGTRWWGRHLYDAKGALRSGANTLEVEVTPPLGNFMRRQEQQAGARRWAWWFPPIPSGLVGPVQLMKPAE